MILFILYMHLYLFVFYYPVCTPGGPCHPWLFIEESAAREVERDFSSVYSRLVLCRTFRLDEDGKVLTPEEVSGS